MRVSVGWLAKVACTCLGLAMVLTAVTGPAYAGGVLFAPEIDPGSMGGGLTLLFGGALLFTGKSRKS